MILTQILSFLQVVSTLRYKHHLSVLLCPLSHGGFIVSNRMAVERKLQSGEPPSFPGDWPYCDCVSVYLNTGHTVTVSVDLNTAPTGSKILSKMRELGELFTRTCLIVEKDPVREGRSR